MRRSRPAGPPTIASIQREAVERLKAALFGSDPYARRRYILDFHQEFRSFRRRVGWKELASASGRADIVFVGDYHALSSCQVFAVRLLEEMVRRHPGRVVLAMEMVFGRHQRVLDRFLAGEIDESDFLRRIRYEQDWGYPWEGYRAIFNAARRLKVPVLAADAEPRGGLATIRRRDTHAAARIASVFAAGGQPRILVLFGESHLARGHLPTQVHGALRRRNLTARSLVIVQNVEAIWWQLAEQGHEETDAVLVSREKYVVFNASPLVKYEAYRQTLDRWRGELYDDGRPDLTPTVHHMIDTILRFLGVDPYRQRLVRPGGADFLVDLYPDVFPVEDEEELRSVLLSEGMNGADATVEAAALGRRGSRYVAPINSLFIRSFELLASVEEATRFIRAVLGGRLSFPPALVAREPAQGPVAILEEALAFFGSKVIDPSRRPIIVFDPDLPTASGRASVSHAGSGVMEEGRRLGQGLYEGYHAGLIDRRGILALFRRDLSRPGTATTVLAALRERLGSGSPPGPPPQARKTKRTG